MPSPFPVNGAQDLHETLCIGYADSMGYQIYTCRAKVLKGRRWGKKGRVGGWEGGRVGGGKDGRGEGWRGEGWEGGDAGKPGTVRNGTERNGTEPEVVINVSSCTTNFAQYFGS